MRSFDPRPTPIDRFHRPAPPAHTDRPIPLDPLRQSHTDRPVPLDPHCPTRITTARSGSQIPFPEPELGGEHQRDRTDEQHRRVAEVVRAVE